MLREIDRLNDVIDALSTVWSFEHQSILDEQILNLKEIVKSLSDGGD